MLADPVHSMIKFVNFTQNEFVTNMGAERSKARYKKIHTKIPLCSREHHVQKYYTLQETDFDTRCPSLPNSISEIHGVQKK